MQATDYLINAPDEDIPAAIPDRYEPIGLATRRCLAPDAALSIELNDEHNR
jgi:hypothetical protein